MSAKVKAAMAAVDAAKRRLEAVVHAEFPVGRRIFFQRTSNGTQLYGEVIMHGYEDRLKVRNLTTDKEYWLDAYWIAGCRP